MGRFVRKIGRWGSVARLSVNLTNEINRAIDISLKRFGLKAQRVARMHIKNQDLAWAPLAHRYVLWKARKNYSLFTYTMTGTYFNNIRTFYDGNTRTAYVGIKRDTMHKAEGRVIRLATIAKELEEGNPAHNLPARPIWKPTLKETVGWYMEGNRAADYLLYALRTRYN